MKAREIMSKIDEGKREGEGEIERKVERDGDVRGSLLWIKSIGPVFSTVYRPSL